MVAYFSRWIADQEPLEVGLRRNIRLAISRVVDLVD